MAFCYRLFNFRIVKVRSLVRIAGGKPDLFPVRVGPCQGCPYSPVLFIIFMDRTSRHSQAREGIKFGGLRIPSQLFADEVVLLTSSNSDLQHSLGRFAAKCDTAGMWIINSKSGRVVFRQKWVDYPPQVGGESLPQVEEFNYLRFL